MEYVNGRAREDRWGGTQGRVRMAADCVEARLRCSGLFGIPPPGDRGGGAISQAPRAGSGG